MGHNTATNLVHFEIPGKLLIVNESMKLVTILMETEFDSLKYIIYSAIVNGLVIQYRVKYTNLAIVVYPDVTVGEVRCGLSPDNNTHFRAITFPPCTTASQHLAGSLSLSAQQLAVVAMTT